MSKIRHLAIKAEDQEKTATFYKETFGMTEAWRGPVREMGIQDPVGTPVDVSVHGWKA